MDVDTRRGLEEGVPRLLEVFRAMGVQASFFVAMGPDRTGMALRRAWRPSFLLKMWRTRAVGLYGMRTLLSGTLLPARAVGAGVPPLLRQIAAEGHEVAPHGFDHVAWQDRVHRLGAARLRADLWSAARAFEAVFGLAPSATAAPGWRTTPAAVTIQEDLGYRYASDVRGSAPFWPRVHGATLKTLQIPTTLPTMDELLGRVRDIPGVLEASLRPGLNVFTLHAEVEGAPLLGTFRAFLERLARRGARSRRLDQVADHARADAEAIEAAPIVRGRVAGRSGWIAMQGTAG